MDEREPFFKRDVSPFLCILKKTHFVNENWSKGGPVVTTVANVFCLSLNVLQGRNRLH